MEMTGKISVKVQISQGFSPCHSRAFRKREKSLPQEREADVDEEVRSTAGDGVHTNRRDCDDLKSVNG